jgi:hypothetical protein
MGARHLESGKSDRGCQAICKTIWRRQDASEFLRKDQGSIHSLPAALNLFSWQLQAATTLMIRRDKLGCLQFPEPS